MNHSTRRRSMIALCTHAYAAFFSNCITPIYVNVWHCVNYATEDSACLKEKGRRDKCVYCGVGEYDTDLGTVSQLVYWAI